MADDLSWLGLDPDTLKQLQSVMAQYVPSDDEKTTARNHGLLAAGLGMLANSYKPPAVAIGSGGLLGVQSYNNELADLSKQRMNQIQGANASIGLQNQLQALHDQSTMRGLDQQFATKFGPTGAPSAPPQAPVPSVAMGPPSPDDGTGSVQAAPSGLVPPPAPAAPMGAIPSKRAMAQKYQDMGDFFMQNSGGVPAGIAKAQQYYDLAQKTMPQLDKVETALDPASNQPVKVAYYKDGSHEILNDVGAPQDLDIKSVGNAMQGFSKLNGSPVGPATPINLSPDQQITTDIRAAEVDPFGVLGVNKKAQGTGSTAGLTGKDLLAALPPQVAGQVQALAEGRQAFPSGAAFRSPQVQALLGMVSQYDPSFDAVNYNSRNKTRQSATSGPIATSANALNTVLGHMDTLTTAADALNNTSIPIYNSLANTVASNLGDPRVKQFDATKKAVVDELTRVWRGNGGSEGDIKSWAATLDAANSPDQIHGVIGQMGDLLKSKIDALNDQYTKGMGTTAGGLDLLTPKSQQVLDKIQGRSSGQTSSDSSTPSASAPQLTAQGQQNKTVQFVLQEAIKRGDKATIDTLRSKGYVQ